jgi:hypothetical protein
MDVLFPKIGEIIGGSEREADYDKLMTRIDELGIPMKYMGGNRQDVVVSGTRSLWSSDGLLSDAS